MVDTHAAEYDLRADGGMPAALSQSDGGPGGAGETEKDVSSGHAVPRADDGLTPGTPPKSPPRTKRELERALRDLGYAKSQAQAIVSRGFNGLANTDAAEDMSVDELVSHLRTLVKLSKGHET